MRKCVCLLLFLLFVDGLLATAQAPSPDTQTLQSILVEIRKLRLDLQSTAVTVQRMQLLLYRIRTQMEVVDRVRQIHDGVATALAQKKAQRENIINELKVEQEQLDNTQDSNTRQELEQNIRQQKGWLERLEQADPDLLAKEADSANELRLEQGKLNDLQEQLDTLDRSLASVQRASIQ